MENDILKAMMTKWDEYNAINYVLYLAKWLKEVDDLYCFFEDEDQRRAAYQELAETREIAIHMLCFAVEDLNES
jgi:hypothetical protein